MSAGQMGYSTSQVGDLVASPRPVLKKRDE